MRVAIIFSGHTRTFSMCWPLFLWMVGRHFPNAKYFFSTVDDEDFRKAKDQFPEVKGGWTIEAFDKQPEFKFDREWVQYQPYTFEPYPISVPPEAVMRQLWQLEQGYKLYLRSTEEKDLADVVIRTRPDLWWQEFSKPYRPSIDIDMRVGPNDAYVPYWGSFGGINDRFAILGRNAADRYFFTFSNLEKLKSLGAPLHPETLVKASLQLEPTNIYVFDALFSTLRTNGELRVPEIRVQDLSRLYGPRAIL